jgi:hypothetical protein
MRFAQTTSARARRLGGGALAAATLGAALLAGGPPGTAQEPERLRTVPLPAHVPAPISFALVDDGQTIVLSAPFGGAGSTDESVWMIDVRTRAAREIVRSAPMAAVAAPRGHLFALQTLRPPGELLLVRDGVITGWVPHPSPRGVWQVKGRWSRDGRHLVQGLDRPELRSGESAAVPRAFRTLGILEVRTRTLSRHPLRRPAFHVSVGPDGRIHASDLENEDGGDLTVWMYDFEGHAVGMRTGLAGTDFSATGRYVLPRLTDPCRDFAATDTRTGAVARRWRQPRGGCLVVQGWHPTSDDLLLVFRDGERPSEAGRLEVHAVSSGQVVRSFPAGEHAWTPDGRALVLFRDGAFVFEPIAP